MESKKEVLSVLLDYVLPKELVGFFELQDVRLDELNNVLHVYLDEKNNPPADLTPLKLSSNGFYPASLVSDFPLRDRKVVLHVRRRRRVDPQGKSYSSTFNITAQGHLFKRICVFFKRSVWIPFRFRLKALKDTILSYKWETARASL